MNCVRKVASAFFAGVLAMGLMPAAAFAAAGDAARAAEAPGQVTIGDGTQTNGYIGAYGATYKRVGIETIYRADELGSKGTLTSVSFDIRENEDGKDTSLTATSFKIYLGHTSKSQVSVSGREVEFDTEGLTLVYSYENEEEPLTLGAKPGWETFAFNQNDGAFEYNGTDNLMLWIVRESGNKTNDMLLSDCTPTADGSAGTLVKGNTGNVSAFKTPQDVVDETLVSSAYAPALRPNVSFGVEGLCTHGNMKLITIVAPTCTAGGSTVYYCPDCGLDVRVEPTAALGHDMQETARVEASCAAPATVTTECARCGLVESTQTGSKLDHVWDWDHAVTSEDGQWIIASCKNGCTQKASKSTVVAPSAWDGVTATAWTEGDGSEANPYQIATAENLAYLAQMVNTPGSDGDAAAGYAGKHFQMTADIDLGGKEWTPIGKTTAANAGPFFKGSFDGADHSISNLSISHTLATADRNTSYGLFGAVSGAIIENVSIASGAIAISGAASISTATGALVGRVLGEKTVIRKCLSGASVSGSSHAGGLVGYTYGSGSNLTTLEITDSACLANVSTDTTVGSSYAAGLVGYASGNLTLSSCYSTSSITSKNVGGLFNATGNDTIVNVKNCFASGILTGSTKAGSIAGNVGAGADGKPVATVEHCYVTSESYYNNGTPTIKFPAPTNCGVFDATDPTMLDKLNTGLDTPAFKAGTDHPVLVWEGDNTGGNGEATQLDATLSGDMVPASLMIFRAAADGKAVRHETATRAISYDGDGTVNVSCADESVARASYDLVTGAVTISAVGAGMTTVTVSASAGTAYAAPETVVAIPVAVLDVEFKGGSLRMDGADDFTSLRLGYQMKLPVEDATWSWSYALEGSDEPLGTVAGASYVATADGAIVSNLVFTGVPMLVAAQGLQATLSVTATDSAGHEFTWTDIERTRSVEQVACSIAASANAPAADKAYARAVLGL